MNAPSSCRAPLRQRTRWLGLVVAGGCGIVGGLCADEEPVPSRPRIDVQPQSETVTQAANVTFSVTASSTAAMYYQWRFMERDIPGATQSSLALASVDSSLIGPYSVQITNVAGAVTSSVALLRVLGVQRFHQPDPLAIPDGSPLPAPVTSAVVISNLPGRIERLGITLLGLSHPAPDELDVALVGPRGDWAFLMSDAGGNHGLTNAMVDFHDLALAPVPDQGPITPGQYLAANYAPDDDFPAAGSLSPPVPSLSAFLNLEANGPWVLQAADDTAGTAGRLDGGWMLEVGFPLPEPNTLMVELSHPAGPAGSATAVTGFGLLHILCDGTVTYDIRLAGLPAAVQEVHIHGPATNSANAPALFGLQYYPQPAQAGEMRGYLAGYQTHQLWQLRRGLHYVSARLEDGTNSELRGQITPLPLPFIREPPRSQTVRAGGSVTFVVGVTNPAPMTYQWRSNRMSIAGATNAVLRLTGLGSMHQGFYDVVVSNAAGAMVSAPARLSVGDCSPTNWLDVPLGTQGQWSFSEAGCPQPGHLTPCGWMGADARWLGMRPAGEGLLLLDTAGSPEAILMAVYTGDATTDLTYAGCALDNSGAGFTRWQVNTTGANTGFAVELDATRVAQAPFHLNWRFGWPPGLLETPTNQTVRPGDAVTLVVRATGLPVPQLQWQFNGRDLPGATNEVWGIPAAELEDDGEYTVVVRNFMGTTNSPAARLRILTPPRLEHPHISNGRFEFQIAGPPDGSVVIEGSTDLNVWTALWTNAAAFEFQTPLTNQPSGRFYRARSE